MLRRIMMCLVSASVLACTNEAPVAPARSAVLDEIVGRYPIASVNGQALPMQIGWRGSTGVDALSGVIELDSAANFRDILTIRLRGSGGVQVYADTIEGSFFHYQSTLLMQPNDGTLPFFLDIGNDNKTLTSWDYSVIVYKR